MEQEHQDSSNENLR